MENKTPTTERLLELRGMGMNNTEIGRTVGKHRHWISRKIGPSPHKRVSYGKGKEINGSPDTFSNLSEKAYKMGFRTMTGPGAGKRGSLAALLLAIAEDRILLVPNPAHAPTPIRPDVVVEQTEQTA